MDWCLYDSKSVDWFLYDRDLRHERVKRSFLGLGLQFANAVFKAAQ